MTDFKTRLLLSALAKHLASIGVRMRSAQIDAMGMFEYDAAAKPTREKSQARHNRVQSR